MVFKPNILLGRKLYLKEMIEEILVYNILYGINIGAFLKHGYWNGEIGDGTMV